MRTPHQKKTTNSHTEKDLNHNWKFKLGTAKNVGCNNVNLLSPYIKLSGIKKKIF